MLINLRDLSVVNIKIQGCTYVNYSTLHILFIPNDNIWAVMLHFVDYCYWVIPPDFLCCGVTHNWEWFPLFFGLLHICDLTYKLSGNIVVSGGKI